MQTKTAVISFIIGVLITAAFFLMRDNSSLTQGFLKSNPIAQTATEDFKPSSSKTSSKASGAISRKSDPAPDFSEKISDSLELDTDLAKLSDTKAPIQVDAFTEIENTTTTPDIEITPESAPITFSEYSNCSQSGSILETERFSYLNQDSLENNFHHATKGIGSDIDKAFQDGCQFKISIKNATSNSRNENEESFPCFNMSKNGNNTVIENEDYKLYTCNYQQNGGDARIQIFVPQDSNNKKLRIQKSVQAVGTSDLRKIKVFVNQ